MFHIKRQHVFNMYYSYVKHVLSNVSNIICLTHVFYKTHVLIIYFISVKQVFDMC